MRIAVIGAGGVGGYFGGRLALAGNKVIFVARGAHLEAIQKNGLVVKSGNGEFVIKPANASNSYASVEGADLVIVCTKAWQVREVAREIAPFLDPETMVMPLQNGVTAADELMEHIDKSHIVGGLCRIFSKIEAPGVIHHFGAEPTIIFSELDNSHTDRTAWLKYTLEMAGIKNIWADDIQSELWKKFLMICSSGLLAVTETTYGSLRSAADTRKMLFDTFTEVYNVALAVGVNMPDGIVEKTMKAVDSFPADSTSSLTRDVLEGRPSEIEYQNGTIVKLGEKYGVATPVNRYIFESILPREKSARSK
jgi:2-dehydropantoate 2-reductase